MISSCHLVAGWLPQMGADATPGGMLGPHVTECLECQVEVARYRKLGRELVGLASVVVAAPPGLAEAVEIAINRDPIPTNAPRRPNRAAATAGALAAAVAGVAVITLWRRVRQVA